MDPLPEGWSTAVSSKSGKTYFYHAATNVSSYEHPGAQQAAPLPPGWAIVTSAKTGKPYYFNSATGVSSYDHPAGAAPAHKRPRPEEQPSSSSSSSSSSSAAAAAAPAAASTAAAVGDGGAVLAQAVGEAYNRIEEQGRAQRGTSPILHFRNFQNFIKASLFHAFAPQPSPRVLDLCCGRLADLLTKLRAHQVQRYCGIDIAGDSLEMGVRRLEESCARLGPLEVKLVCADVGATDLTAAGVFAPTECFDLVTVQFALHYFFQTEARALAFFANIAGRLAPGGVLLGTTTDADVLVRRLRGAQAAAAAAGAPPGAPAARTFGNSLYRVRFTEGAAAAQWALGSPYGCEYDFWLSERVEREAEDKEESGVPEYLVPWPLLERLAASIGLQPLCSENFHAFYARNAATREGRELLAKMKVFDCEGTISREEWEVAGLYRVFAFRMPHSSSSSSSPASTLPPNDSIFGAPSAARKAIPAALSPLAYSRKITVSDIQNIL